MTSEFATRALSGKCCKRIREWAPGKFMFCGQKGWAYRNEAGERGAFCPAHVPDGWESTPWDSEFESNLLVDYVHDL